MNFLFSFSFIATHFVESHTKTCHQLFRLSHVVILISNLRISASMKINSSDGVDLNYNGLDHCVRKNGGRATQFSADCIVQFSDSVSSEEEELSHFNFFFVFNHCTDNICSNLYV